MNKKLKYELPLVEEIQMESMSVILEDSKSFGTEDYNEQNWNWGD